MKNKQQTHYKNIESTSKINCYMCGNYGIILYSSITDRLYDIPGNWQILYCEACQLAWLNPKPTTSEMEKIYPEKYMAHSNIKKLRTSKFRYIKNKIGEALLSGTFGYHKIFRHRKLGVVLGRIKFIRDHVGAEILWLRSDMGKKLLDIGCGTGKLLETMHNLGWEVSGVEPDIGAARIAGERIGKDLVYTCTLEKACLMSNSFDVITFNHVIEHLPHPLQTLSTAKSLLKTGGRLVIITPNLNSLAHKLFRSSWIHLDPPRHFYLFTLPGLISLIEQLGMTVEKVWTPARGATYAWAASRYIQKHLKMIGGRLPQPLKFGTRIETIGFNIIEVITNLFLSAGEEVVLFARKRTRNKRINK